MVIYDLKWKLEFGVFSLEYQFKWLFDCETKSELHYIRSINRNNLLAGCLILSKYEMLFAIEYFVEILPTNGEYKTQPQLNICFDHRFFFY